MTRAWAIIVGLTLMIRGSPAQGQVLAGRPSVSETRVVRFAPGIPSGDIREGSCWTVSIAVSRGGAWRCMVGNAISDPCFTIPGNRGELVCDANPALKAGGFVLKLTKPLPKLSAPNTKPEPWIFVLADGSICQAMTGTLSPVNGEPARWACAIHAGDKITPSGLVTALAAGKVWIAEKFPESAIGRQGVTPERVPVETVWE